MRAKNGTTATFYGATDEHDGPSSFARADRRSVLPDHHWMLMIAAGVKYWIDNFVLFLGLPKVPYLDLLPVTLIAEASLALWLLIVGVNEAKWRAMAARLKAAA
jgi:hypothetical protein